MAPRKENGAGSEDRENAGNPPKITKITCRQLHRLIYG